MPKPKPLPDQQTLRALLDYDPETGDLRWKRRPAEMFPDDRACHSWNTRYEGTPALASISFHGYRFGTLLGKVVKAHRVIWKLVYGVEALHIDHINHCRPDNSISNLRNCSNAENHRNMGETGKVNRSGHQGIYYDDRHATWQVYAGRAYYVGRFKSLDAAVKARGAALRNAGFHQNHGTKRG